MGGAMRVCRNSFSMFRNGNRGPDLFIGARRGVALRATHSRGCAVRPSPPAGLWPRCVAVAPRGSRRHRRRYLPPWHARVAPLDCVLPACCARPSRGRPERSPLEEAAAAGSALTGLPGSIGAGSGCVVRRQMAAADEVSGDWPAALAGVRAARDAVLLCMAGSACAAARTYAHAVKEWVAGLPEVGGKGASLRQPQPVHSASARLPASPPELRQVRTAFTAAVRRARPLELFIDDRRHTSLG